MSDNRDFSHQHISDFYKQEFLKHKSRLEVQREFCSDKEFDEAVTAIDKLVSEMDTICSTDQFSELASKLLARLDAISRLSGSPSSQTQRIH